MSRIHQFPKCFHLVVLSVVICLVSAVGCRPDPTSTASNESASEGKSPAIAEEGEIGDEADDDAPPTETGADENSVRHVANKPVEESTNSDQHGSDTSESENESSASSTDGTTEVSGSGAVEEDPVSQQESEEVTVDELAATLRTFVTQRKEEYQEELSNQAEKLDEKVEQMEAHAEARAENLTRVKELRQELQEKMDELDTESARPWKELREEIDTTWEELKQAFDKASRPAEQLSSDEESAAKTQSE